MKKIKRIETLLLTVLMVLSFAGCGKSNLPSETENGGGAENTPGSAETVVYELPAGAASEYDLYEIVVDYLNNGFHYADLRDVYDPILTLAFFSKWEYDAEDIYTLGMKYDEACDLIARLKAKAAEMDLPRDEYGEIDEDRVDYNALQSEFPEYMQTQIMEVHESFQDYFENYIEYFIYDDLVCDGENPFGTDQTKWEKESRDAFEIYEYDNYDDFDKDLYDNFPRIYGMKLGEYQRGNEIYSMSAYITEIEGEYYLLHFTYISGVVGG